MTDTDKISKMIKDRTKEIAELEQALAGPLKEHKQKFNYNITLLEKQKELKNKIPPDLKPDLDKKKETSHNLKKELFNNRATYYRDLMQFEEVKNQTIEGICENVSDIPDMMETLSHKHALLLAFHKKLQSMAEGNDHYKKELGQIDPNLSDECNENIMREAKALEQMLQEALSFLYGRKVVELVDN